MSPHNMLRIIRLIVSSCDPYGVMLNKRIHGLFNSLRRGACARLAPFFRHSRALKNVRHINVQISPRGKKIFVRKG